MVKRRLHRTHRPSHASDESGAALAIGLILLLVISLLGTAGLMSATLELQMSSNLEFQERAFQAADYAIEQALNSSGINTGYTLANPLVVPSAGASSGVPGTAFDTYSYTLYYDTSAGSTPIPGGATPGEYRVAYHFVVIGNGSSSRGSTDTHTQGFYVLGTPGCELPGANCDFSGAERRRTYWSQRASD